MGILEISEIILGNRKRFEFQKALEHVIMTSEKEHISGINDLDGVVRVYYHPRQSKYFTCDGQEVEVTPVGENIPQIINFHWSNSQEEEMKVIASKIVEDARKSKANAFMFGKPENAHGNNIYAYILLRARFVPNSRISPMISYQLGPDGQLLPRNSDQPF